VKATGYAFHTGVPFIVLTDGRTWSFYLPPEQGSYVAESAETLTRYLAYKSVVSGEALDTAGKEYRSRNRRSQTECRTSGARCHGRRFRGNPSPTIPEAWRELVEKSQPDRSPLDLSLVLHIAV
jgi:hypothetical protein